MLAELVSMFSLEKIRLESLIFSFSFTIGFITFTKWNIARSKYAAKLRKKRGTVNIGGIYKFTLKLN